MTSIMEAARVVEVSVRLWSGGVGPAGDGNKWWSRVLMRDQAFFVSLARDVRLGVQEMMEEVEEEKMALARRVRARGMESAEKVLDAVRRRRLAGGLSFDLFSRCIRGETPRQIIRRVRDRPGWSVVGELQNWVLVVDDAVSPAEIDLLLTLRRAMA